MSVKTDPTHPNHVASQVSDDGKAFARDMFVTDRLEWILNPKRLRRLREWHTVLVGIHPRGNGPSVAALQTAALGAGFRADQVSVFRSGDKKDHVCVFDPIS